MATCPRPGCRMPHAMCIPMQAVAWQQAGVGCVRIERFDVVNHCPKGIELLGWSRRVAAGETASIEGRRSEDLGRLSWRLQDGPWGYDYIELNGAWTGAGTDLCAHPNYATWFGFSTSSRYEALDPSSGQLSCADAGAEVDFSAASCPAGFGPSSRFACDFRATQDSIRDCASTQALYQEHHTRCISGDGSRASRYSTSLPGEWRGNWANYPCAPESSNWPGYGVGTWIDCTNKRKSVVLKVTLCPAF
mmetsp:Transcript_175598/g.563153  ORF Transcript_175598/g.563153 Transcript_175598/m.563153 type:complete len:248 (-) Transcript_175598:99-842(-)